MSDAQALVFLRALRDAKLAVCDWTQARDVTLSNDDAWKTYRQALRDLPANSSPKLNTDGALDLSSFTFPTEPS